MNDDDSAICPAPPPDHPKETTMEPETPTETGTPPPAPVPWAFINIETGETVALVRAGADGMPTDEMLEADDATIADMGLRRVTPAEQAAIDEQHEATMESLQELYSPQMERGKDMLRAEIAANRREAQRAAKNDQEG